MKKLILALGILLMSASVFANHLTGLKQHQSGQSTNGQLIQQGSQLPIAQAVYTSNTKRQNIITDPQSCIDRWGDHCVDPVVPEAVALDLGDITVADHLVNRSTETVLYEDFDSVTITE
jgi:hypothetical protein